MDSHLVYLLFLVSLLADEQPAGAPSAAVARVCSGPDNLTGCPCQLSAHEKLAGRPAGA